MAIHAESVKWWQTREKMVTWHLGNQVNLVWISSNHRYGRGEPINYTWYLLFSITETENGDLICPGFDLPRHTGSLINRFRTGQALCRANLHKWGLTQSPSCNCGLRQTMNHIIDMCPLTKFEGGLNLLHKADDDASYGCNLQRLQHSQNNNNNNWTSSDHTKDRAVPAFILVTPSASVIVQCTALLFCDPDVPVYLLHANSH